MQMHGSARERLLVTALLVAAGLLRLSRIEAHGPWLDELLSVTSAMGASLDVGIVAPGVSFQADDLARNNTLGHVRDAVFQQDRGNGILYNVLLHGWIKVFGATDASVRFPSVAAGVVIVFLVH